MPRRTKEDKAHSRRLIVTSAAKLFRERGIENASVSDVMKDAGLTHGGFYRHFESKEELAVAAIAEAFQAGLSHFTENPKDPAAEAAAYVNTYLSSEHVENPNLGCPIQLLGSEIARGPEIWQMEMTQGIQHAINGLARALGNDRAKATDLLARLVGAIVLARATSDPALQQSILETVRKSSDIILP